MAAEKKKKDLARKFDEETRERYLQSLRSGNLKFESARLVGVSYRTIERRRADDDEFRVAEAHALAEAREGVEKVLHDMAMDRDIAAIKLWLTAHDRSTYGDKKTVEVDATPAALALGQAEALGRIAELQATLEQRRLALESDDSTIIDLPSEELDVD